MALDPRFICSNTISPVFVDIRTGKPLSGGYIEFYQDTNRVSPKLVYQLSGTGPSDYTFEPLTNPLYLNGSGQMANPNTGYPIAVYYFPYASMDADAPLDLYYLKVFASNGEYQYDRQAWPFLDQNESGIAPTEQSYDNVLSNSQFVTINFTSSAGDTLTVSFGAGTNTTLVEIAPGWTLKIGSSDTGSVTIDRTAIAGTSNYEGNPPYTLTITPGANVTSLMLYQRMEHNPNIWSPITGGDDGYLASSILLAPLTSVTMFYTPSSGTSTQLLSENNLDGIYKEFSNTVQLPAGSNSQTADVGYVDIQLVLSPSNVSILSNVQVVSTETQVGALPYDQQSVNTQKSNLFYYYNPKLQYKPIPSYLIGWDFHLNPAQLLGTNIAAQAVGANKSYYAWDQTIIFQSADSAFLTRRAITGNGSLELDAETTAQCAIIQYLPQATARAILNDRISVALSLLTNHTGGLVGTVSLWYTKDGSLPSISSTNNSIVATLNATGGVATQNGTWIEVPRGNLGEATFKVATSVTNNFDKHTFSGWDMKGVADTNLATYFAIVVGFAPMISTDVIDFDSVSLVAGDIATEPSPETPAQVLLDCQQFYTKSFLQGTVPVNSAGLNTSEYIFTAGKAGALTSYSSSVLLPTTMNVTPTITLYSVAGTTGQAYDETAAAACSGTVTSLLSNKAFSLATVGNASTAVGNQIGVHFTADSRLGK